MTSDELEVIRDRFWPKVDRRGPDECWLWRACRDRQGRGLIRMRGVKYMAHRVAYMLEHGPLDPEVMLWHTCDAGHCVNPRHLRIAGLRRDWSDDEDHYLRRMYCFVPVRQIAKELGRSATAIQSRRKTLRIRQLQERPELMGVMDFAQAVGLSWSAALKLAKQHPFSTTMYHGNRPVTVILIDSFKRWLRDPLNWRYLSVDKLVRPDFRVVVQVAQEHKRDRWLTLTEAAEYVSYSRTYFYRLIRAGSVPYVMDYAGKRGRKQVLIKLSDLDRFKQTY